MTASSKLSPYTDVTWSAKTLNMSIFRFFSTLKSGLGPSPGSVGLPPSKYELTTKSPLLTWERFRDHLNLINPDSSQERQEYSQLKLLKETILDIGHGSLQPVPAPSLPLPGRVEKLDASKKTLKHVKLGLLQPLNHRIVEDFRNDFYKVPPPLYMKLPHVGCQEKNEDTLNLVSTFVGKLQKIPLWEQYRRFPPNAERELVSGFEDLQRKVVKFQEGYEDTRINLRPILEFVRAKQLNTSVFIKQCKRLSDETQLLKECVGLFHTETYDSFLNNKLGRNESYLIHVVQENFNILMEMLFDLQHASPLCEDRLELCSEAISKVKSVLIAGEDAFQSFQVVHGKYVQHDTFLERYFWKLWWHFDIIQQELYGGGVKEAYEQHQKVLLQCIYETSRGKALISMAESKLRGLHLLMTQVERIHETRMSARSVLQHFAGR